MTRLNVAGLGSESAEQQALFAWWHAVGHLLAPGALLFAIPNGGKRTASNAARLKREGVLAGIPDIMLAWPAHGYHGLFVEMKRAQKSRATTTSHQKAAMATLEAAGYRCLVAYGFREAMAAIEAYLSGAPEGVISGFGRERR